MIRKMAVRVLLVLSLVNIVAWQWWSGTHTQESNWHLLAFSLLGACLLVLLPFPPRLTHHYYSNRVPRWEDYQLQRLGYAGLLIVFIAVSAIAFQQLGFFKALPRSFMPIVGIVGLVMAGIGHRSLYRLYAFWWRHPW